jgi:hypothetical protein
MTGLTLVPAVLKVAAYLPPPLTHSRPINHAGEVTLVVSVGHDYQQGSATYNPNLGEKILFYGGGVGRENLVPKLVPDSTELSRTPWT